MDEIIILAAISATAVVSFIIGKMLCRKALSPVLMNQHACLNWALQYVFPFGSDGNVLTGADMSIWYKDYEKSKKVAKGDMDALLFEK